MLVKGAPGLITAGLSVMVRIMYVFKRQGLLADIFISLRLDYHFSNFVFRYKSYMYKINHHSYHIRYVYGKSVLAWIMACCCQGTSHYLNQWWRRSLCHMALNTGQLDCSTASSSWQHGKQKSLTFMMTSSNGNVFSVTGHLCGEFTGPRWIPRTKASDVELWCFLWSASK